MASADFEEILEMYLEKDSNKYIQPLLNKSVRFYQEFLARKLKLNTPIVGVWTVRDKGTHELIGTINLNNLVTTELTQIGCHLKRAFWNQGLATELMCKLVEFAFEVRQLDRIHAVYQDGNSVSSKMLKRLGFSLLETRNWDGELVHLHGLNRKDYQNKKYV
jgi:RimJ/RimL family protein N-acetyltransferase